MTTAEQDALRMRVRDALRRCAPAGVLSERDLDRMARAAIGEVAALWSEIRSSYSLETESRRTR